MGTASVADIVTWKTCDCQSGWYGYMENKVTVRMAVIATGKNGD